MKSINRTIVMLALAFLCGMAQAQTQTSENPIYIKLEVDGLSCPFCAYGLEKKLKKIPGASAIYINIKEGFATLKTPAKVKPTEEEINRVVKEAGFTPRTILFSEKPFDPTP